MGIFPSKFSKLWGIFCARWYQSGLKAWRTWWKPKACGRVLFFHFPSISQRKYSYVPYNSIKRSLICLKHKNEAPESVGQSLSYWTVEYGILFTRVLTEEYCISVVYTDGDVLTWAVQSPEPFACSQRSKEPYPCGLQPAPHFNLCSGGHTSATPLSSNTGLSTKFFWWHAFSKKNASNMVGSTFPEVNFWEALWSSYTTG